jgi:nuclear transport factor 2 (NTF2) superfamily protein
MMRREASINDVPIRPSERRIFGPRDTSDPDTAAQEIPLQ